MLSERQLELMAERVYQRLHAVNSYYIEKIGARIKQVGNLDEKSQKQLQNLTLWRIEDVKQIEARLASETGKALNECREIIEIVAEDALEETKPIYNEKGFDFVALQKNKVLYDLVKDVIAETQGELENLTKTTAINQSYKDALDKVFLQATTGLETYDKATESVCRELAERGIYKVTYDKNGKQYRRRLDTSARQAIITGMKNVNLRMSERLAEELDAEGWQISYHANPRPSHRAMGGQVYTLQQFKDAGIQAKLDEFNCLHTKYPYWFGISSPQYSDEELTRLKKEDSRKIMIDGKEMDKYEVSQIQRRLETQIRYQSEVKAVAVASNNKGLELHAKGEITKLKQEYKKISEKAGLPTKPERYKIHTN